MNEIEKLREAVKNKNLTLYLGAGVSVANGLPTWDSLVLAMYFTVINEVPLGGWRPFTNYLFAISEWHLESRHEPLEITARKIRNHFDNQGDFLKVLKDTLYSGFKEYDDAQFDYIDEGLLLQSNPTLAAIKKLCTETDAGIKSVITYNYDSLLEIVLGNINTQIVYNNTDLQNDILPIYHVHGFVPYGDEVGSKGDDIIFTEEQYHQVTQDVYSWSNLVQIQCMSGSVGLMIGLSLTDRNMRRLLDAVKNTPMNTENYALLQLPKYSDPSPEELTEINEKAISYMDKFLRTGLKRSFTGTKGSTWEDQIIGILKKVEEAGVNEQTKLLQQLGITPIWYKDHEEIPKIIDEIINCS